MNDFDNDCDDMKLYLLPQPDPIFSGKDFLVVGSLNDSVSSLDDDFVK